MPEIIGNCDGAEMDKRFYLGVVIRDNCPNCGKVCEKDLSCNSYLSYPIIGQPTETYLYCPNCDEADKPCEWPVSVVLRMSIELAD